MQEISILDFRTMFEKHCTEEKTKCRICNWMRVIVANEHFLYADLQSLFRLEDGF